MQAINDSDLIANKRGPATSLSFTCTLWVIRLLEVGLIQWIYDYMITESPKY